MEICLLACLAAGQAAAGPTHDLSPDAPALQWWRDAERTREQRLGWWREARLGCFIHWNASSLPAGEWQGKEYRGYAEHIQRMAKIPCSVYRRDVVGRFNPTNFNADAWVRAIKAAGMRYLVITAKHHDGFAMFDSAASDYNIVKATPFGRDPMKELKAACDREGLKFGFYYSHAFDWGEPDAPGNDWDYQNPGGDRNLYGGRAWYEEHPELISRMRPYVDRKAIPQVRELLRNYDPAILWFDTPHKLPPEENLRILKAAREIKPGVVINSRGVQPYDGAPARRFGDYQSTGDRAVDFRPVEDDWETIPTTNESYGYSKNDRSHKTPGFLIHVMAKAAARGGNMLLNIGPRGDGAIDPPDLAILGGLGRWMAVNEAAVRGTVRTTLPVQPWGESTRKGDTFYLHVFDWPADGVLEIGGFRGEVRKAWLLADTRQAALKHRRVDELTLQVDVPGQAPDPDDSVVAVEVDDARRVGDRRLLSVRRSNVLRAFDGTEVGGGFEHGDGKADRNDVFGWRHEDQAVTWPVYLCASGAFDVAVEYAPEGGGANARPFVVSAGTKALRGQAETGGKGFRTQSIARMNLPAGPHLIALRPVGTPAHGLMRLRAVHFRPAPGG